MSLASLRSRLDHLGASSPAPPAANPSLSDLYARIERLRGKAQQRHVRQSETVLASKLGGDQVAPGLIRVERRIPLWYRVGRVDLRSGAEVRNGNLPGDSTRLLFLDTETTGLSGGTGTVAFLVGWGRLADNHFRVVQYLLTSFGGEAEMLSRLADDLGHDDYLVTFNGKSYDLPLLATRYRLMRRESPLSSLAHLDLLHALRKRYGKRLPDCRLKTLEKHLLGLERQDDLPGSEAPEAWRRWLQRQDAGLIKPVVSHNRSDILAMLALIRPLADAGRDSHPSQALRLPSESQQPG